MTPEKMLDDIMAYFAQGKYVQAVQDRMHALITSIGEVERDSVLEHLIETQKASFKVGVSDIVESCRALGVGFRAARFVPAEMWTCDACSHDFKFTLAPSDDDKIDRGMYDYCPMCGFQPGWTKLADKYRAMGIATPWLDKLLEECASSFGLDAKPHMVRKGGDMTLSRGGIFWARSMAESERKEDRRISIEVKMEALGKAKRWDLKGKR